MKVYVSRKRIRKNSRCQFWFLSGIIMGLLAVCMGTFDDIYFFGSMILYALVGTPLLFQLIKKRRLIYQLVGVLESFGSITLCTFVPLFVSRWFIVVLGVILVIISITSWDSALRERIEEKELLKGFEAERL